jgi:hypothetical protein
VPTTEEYRRAAAVPDVSVETVIVVDAAPFIKCATVVVKTTETPGVLICMPFWSYILAVIVEEEILSARTDGGEAVNTIIDVGAVKLT